MGKAKARIRFSTKRLIYNAIEPLYRPRGNAHRLTVLPFLILRKRPPRTEHHSAFRCEAWHAGSRRPPETGPPSRKLSEAAACSAEAIARRAKQSTRRQSTRQGLLETSRLSTTRTRPGMLEKLANTERQLRRKAVRRFQSGSRQHGKDLMRAVQQYKRRQRALRKSALQNLKAQDENLQATVLVDMNTAETIKNKKNKKKKKQ